MDCSKETVRQFLKVMLGLKPPHVMFHQTFTFRGRMTDRCAAKRRLNRTLGTLHRRFNMVSVYVTEDRNRRELHYHVAFMFYEGDVQPCQPTELRNVFSQAAFEAWNRANGGNLNRTANLLKVQACDFDTLRYFTKEVRIVEGPRPSTNWSGARPTALVRQHSKGLTRNQLNRDVRLNFHRLFGAQLFRAAHTHHRSWNAELFLAYKNYYSALFGWNAWKHWSTLANRAISDAEFFAFLRSNGRQRPWLKDDGETL